MNPSHSLTGKFSFYIIEISYSNESYHAQIVELFEGTSLRNTFEKLLGTVDSNSVEVALQVFILLLLQSFFNFI